MTSAPRETISARRLTELRRAGTGDATLHNLLSALGAKLDLCARLPVFEYEAASEGHEASAAFFRELAEAERSSFEELTTCLQRYLNQSPAANGSDSRMSQEASG